MEQVGLTSSQLEKRIKRKKLGQLLVEKGMLTSEGLEQALHYQRDHGGRLGGILEQLGLVDAQDLVKVLSEQLSVPVLDVRSYRVPPEVLRLIPEAMARERCILPVRADQGRLLLAMAFPEDLATISDVKAIVNMPVSIGICTPDEIRLLLDLYYRADIEKSENSAASPEAGETDRKGKAGSKTAASFSRSLDDILKQAIRDRASDVHIEPQQHHLHIRYRIDGILHEAYTLPLAAHLPIMSRLKVLSEMDIAENRRPQDGQMTFESQGAQTDIRVATVGTSRGERATLRLLNNVTNLRELDKIGLAPDAFATVQELLTSTSGMILVGGPTGSGKTTTLYAIINHLNNGSCNIMTIEDPIEYNFDGVSQIPVNQRAGITFSAGLRSLLRQDPDVILVGEIRDRETAEIAIQAALTGQLVMASIHANDAVSIISRLMELDIEPYLISSTIIGLISQRMVRRTCSYCGKLLEPSPEERSAFRSVMGKTIAGVMTGQGCTLCANTGYHGRTGIFEVLPVSEEIRHVIATSKDRQDMKRQVMKSGLKTMQRDGMEKAEQGITTIFEVLRTISIQN